MKAVQLNENQKLEFVDVKEAECGPQDVRVKVYAAGICGSDTHKLATGWKYDLPAIMGHEFSGEIIEVGEDVTDRKVGDRVVGIPLIPDRECIYCEQGHYGMCEHYKMIGTHYGGGFAENVVLPAVNTLDIGNMEYEKAALIEPIAVAMHAILNINVQVGDTAVVLGSGPIGVFAMKCLELAGAKEIIAVDIVNDALSFALEHGATKTINSLEENLELKVMDYTNQLGADIVLECAGSKITQEQALLLGKKHGKIGYLGIAYSDVLMHERAFENIFRREYTVKGFWNSYSAPFPGKAWTSVLDFINSEKLDLSDMISHRYPLEKTPEAFEMILSRKEPYRKVMILPQEVI